MQERLITALDIRRFLAADDKATIPLRSLYFLSLPALRIGTRSKETTLMYVLTDQLDTPAYRPQAKRRRRDFTSVTHDDRAIFANKSHPHAAGEHIDQSPNLPT